MKNNIRFDLDLRNGRSLRWQYSVNDWKCEPGTWGTSAVKRFNCESPIWGFHFFLNQHNLLNLIKWHFFIGRIGRSTIGDSRQTFYTGVAFILAVCLWASHLTSLTLEMESLDLNLVGVVGIQACSHGRCRFLRQQVEVARSLVSLLLLFIGKSKSQIQPKWEQLQNNIVKEGDRRIIVSNIHWVSFHF